MDKIKTKYASRTFVVGLQWTDLKHVDFLSCSRLTEIEMKTAGKWQKVDREHQKEWSTSYWYIYIYIYIYIFFFFFFNLLLETRQNGTRPPELTAKLVYVQTHSVPSRACQCLQPSHFGPVAPGRHVQSPVTASHGTGIEPWGSHSHSWQEPPRLLGLPV